MNKTTRNEVLKVVVIDDDPDICEILGQFAEAMELTSSSFQRVQDIDYSELDKADIIFLDLLLDAEDGLDVIQTMHERNISTPIVICSGMDSGIISSAEDLLRDYGLHYVATLTKPFTFDTYVKIVEQAPENKIDQESSHQKDTIVLTKNDIRVGLSSDWIKVVYQPQVNPQTNKMTGVECLVRMEHPLYGMCFPDQFLEQTKQGGMMDELTHVVIRQGIDTLIRSDLSDDVIISFNLDPSSINQSFLQWILNTIDEFKISPNRLCIEITEVSSLALSKEVKTTLTKLRIRGVGVSMDDFGTGYSTIQELNELPFNELKIDRTFVNSMREKDTSLAIVRSTLELGQRLNYRIVAEGVETEDQMKLLMELGCEDFQGYYFSRPIHYNDLIDFYHKL